MAKQLVHRNDLSDREIVVWALKRLSDALEFPYNEEHEVWLNENYTPEQIKAKKDNHVRIKSLLQAIDNGDVSLDGVIPE